MAEPPEADIVQVCDFTGLNLAVDRDVIVAALKKHHGNAEAVVAAFYDDEAKFRNSVNELTWDESVFLGDRDGVGAKVSVPTFSIHAADEGTVIHGVSPPPGHHPTAPSRPPSRNQSPLGVPVGRVQEDIDLERAMAESRAMSGMQSPQETGLTQPENLPFFGPATKDEYDPSQWAMVTTIKENPEPGPSGRKRQDDHPAFLRCRRTGWDVHRLGGILAILHAIPAARNVLVELGSPLANYGSSSEWWKGSPIVRRVAPTDEQWGAEAVADFAEELHRLMAFLDSTDRSYATADNLLQTQAWKYGDWPAADAEKHFYEALREHSTDGRHTLFWTYVDEVHLSDGTITRQSDFGVLTFALAKDQYALIDSVYDALNTILWPDPLVEGLESSRIAVATTFGDVITLRFDGDGLQKPLDIPEVLYCDKYLSIHREVAAKLLEQLRSVQRALDKGAKLQDVLVKWVETSGRVRDRRDLSKQAIEMHQGQLWRLKADSVWRRHEKLQDTPEHFDFALTDIESLLQLTDEEELVAQNYEAQISLHERKLAEIDRKLEKLRAEQDACHSLMKKLNMQYTAPSEADGWDPCHRYSLRGVATTPEITYVCMRGEADLIELDDVAPSRDQWWRLAYMAQEATPVVVEKTTFEAVVKAAFDEGEKKPVLIYASEAAMEVAPVPLPEALQTFVRFDNRLFKQELIEESPLERKRASNDVAPSPSKRHQRESTPDSVATNRASIGDLSDRGDLDDLIMTDTNDSDVFQGQPDASLGTEMVQLAISRPGGSAPTDAAVTDLTKERVVADWDNPEGVPLKTE